MGIPQSGGGGRKQQRGIYNLGIVGMLPRIYLHSLRHTLRITVGTDKSGFAMHKSIDSAVKKQILDRSSADYKRRIVRGKIISQDIEQVNAVIEAYGSKPLAELFKPEGEKKPKEEKK